MTLRINRVVVLIGENGVRSLRDDPPGDGIVGTWIIRLDRSRRDHHPRAEGPQQADLFLAHLVWHDEDRLIPLQRTGDRKAYPRVAGSGFHHCPTRSQHALPLIRLNDRVSDSILNRAAGVDEFELGVDWSLQAAGDAVQPHQRRLADCLQDAVVDPALGRSI